MTRPEIIRADTLDLQDHHLPSAQDHSRQPVHPSPLGMGPAAPHQDAELRHVYDERHAEQDHLVEAWTGRSSQDGAEPNGVHQSPGHADEPELDGSLMHQNGDLDEQSDEGEGDPENEEDLEDDRMDKISSSPSIDDEEIDFEFVYALHTFVATVEGQANATKGDTMVLLDDSNSYWWLVKVVKDSSIGYLPAEHIETPTERLARLNKHRNIDLSQAMLTDKETSKSMNPLKKAMRRRQDKKVDFRPPTYYEPPVMDWSDEEDGDDSGDAEDGLQENGVTGEGEDEIQREDGRGEGRINGDAVQGTGEIAHEGGEARAGLDHERTSDDMLETDMTSPRSRNGTLRNTDSFFKDDTAEPRKITLTPNLLREDGSGRSSESSTKAADVFDKLDRADKVQSPTDKTKEDKKKKDKKPGMLSGLFKKKDKKVKVDEAAGGILTSTSPVSPVSDSGRASPSARNLQSPTAMHPPSLRQGKLQKPPPGTRQSVGPPSPVVGQSGQSLGAEGSPMDATLSSTTAATAATAAAGAAAAAAAATYSLSSDSTTSTSTSTTTPTLSEPPPQPIYTQTILPAILSVDTANASSPTPNESPSTSATDPHAPAPSDPKSSTDMSARSVPESTSSPGSSSPATTPVATTPPPALLHGDWDEGQLRTYLDNGSSATDVRELLLLVHDKTSVVPAPRNHPLMLSLGFEQHQKQIDLLSARLDGLLHGYLARKAARAAAVG